MNFLQKALLVSSVTVGGLVGSKDAQAQASIADVDINKATFLDTKTIEPDLMAELLEHFKDTSKLYTLPSERNTIFIGGETKDGYAISFSARDFDGNGKYGLSEVLGVCKMGQGKDFAEVTIKRDEQGTLLSEFASVTKKQQQILFDEVKGQATGRPFETVDVLVENNSIKKLTP